MLKTFNETAAAASSDKITFGTIAAIWSASVGVSAIQETLNAVYKMPETRSYLMARLQAISLTLLLIVVWSLTLASMFGGDFVGAWCYRHLHAAPLAFAAANAARTAGWVIATAFLALSFALVYWGRPIGRYAVGAGSPQAPASEFSDGFSAHWDSVSIFTTSTLTP